MNDYPLLTICVLTYNCEEFIEKTLTSLIDQTYPNFEILVSDNGSTDRTLRIIEELQKHNPGARIKIRHNTPKIVPGARHEPYCDNVNGCLKSGLISGEIVAFCHHHDVYHKDFARKEAEFLIDNPGAGAVFASCNIISSKGKKTGELRPPKEFGGRNAFNFDDIFQALMINGNHFLTTPTFMARKEIFSKVGLFDEERFGPSRDLALWLRIAEKYPIGVLNQVLMDWKNEGSKTKSQYLWTQRADFFNVMDYYLYEKNLIKKMGEKCLRHYNYKRRFDDTLRAMNLLIKGDGAEARNMINKKTAIGDILAFFENINTFKIKGEILRLVLLLGLFLRLDKPIKKILYKLRYG